MATVTSINRYTPHPFVPDANSFLGRRFQELNSNPQTFYLQSTLLKIAAVATVFLFSTLFIGAFGWAGVAKSVYTPLIGITGTLSITPLTTVYQYLSSRAQKIEAYALYLEKIQSIDREVQQLNTRDLKKRVVSHEPFALLNSPALRSQQNMEKARPLLIHLLYWKRQVDYLIPQAKKQLRVLNQIDQKNESELHQSQVHYLHLAEEATAAKIRYAFLTAVLNQKSFETYKGSATKDVFKMSFPSFSALSHTQENERHHLPIVTFHKNLMKPLTAQHLHQWSHFSLSRYLAKAIV